MGKFWGDFKKFRAMLAKCGNHVAGFGRFGISRAILTNFGQTFHFSTCSTNFVLLGPMRQGKLNTNPNFEFLGPSNEFDRCTFVSALSRRKNGNPARRDPYACPRARAANNPLKQSANEPQAQSATFLAK